MFIIHNNQKNEETGINCIEFINDHLVLSFYLHSMTFQLRRYLLLQNYPRAVFIEVYSVHTVNYIIIIYNYNGLK